MSDDDDFDDDGNDGNHNVEGNDGNDRHEHSLCHRLSLRGAPSQQPIKSNAAKNVTKSPQCVSLFACNNMAWPSWSKLLKRRFQDSIDSNRKYDFNCWKVIIKELRTLLIQS